MQRKHLEIAMMGIIANRLNKVRHMLEDFPVEPEFQDARVSDVVAAMLRHGLGRDLGNLAESFALGDDNRIGVRATVAGFSVPTDRDRPIVIKLEADNNALTGVQLAMLGDTAVDLTGCQGELFAASDLGIHLPPQMEMFEGAA